MALYFSITAKDQKTNEVSAEAFFRVVARKIIDPRGVASIAGPSNAPSSFAFDFADNTSLVIQHTNGDAHISIEAW